MFLFKHVSILTLCSVAGSPLDYGTSVELCLQLVSEEDTNGQQNEYFITDIQDFKNGLFVYPVHSICSQMKNTAQTNKEGK